MPSKPVAPVTHHSAPGMGRELRSVFEQVAWIVATLMMVAVGLIAVRCIETTAIGDDMIVKQTQEDIAIGYVMEQYDARGVVLEMVPETHDQFYIMLWHAKVSNVKDPTDQQTSIGLWVTTTVEPAIYSGGYTAEDARNMHAGALIRKYGMDGLKAIIEQQQADNE